MYINVYDVVVDNLLSEQNATPLGCAFQITSVRI